MSARKWRVQPTESSEIHRADRDLVLMCIACHKELCDIPEGDVYFIQVLGRCSCSWCCCDVAQPANEAHDRHLEVVDPATGEVMVSRQHGERVRP